LAAKLFPLANEFGATHVSRLAEELKYIATDLSEAGNLRGDSVPFPQGKNMGKVFSTVEELSGLIRESIEAGHTEPGERPNDLARSFLTNTVLTQATSDLYDGEILPIVVTGADADQLTDLRGNLFEGRVFVVQAGSTDFEANVDASLSGKFGKKKVVDILLKAKKATTPSTKATAQEEEVVEAAVEEATPTAEAVVSETVVSEESTGDIDETS
jgi:hypothetical protein